MAKTAHTSEDIGQAIRRARTRKGMTQGDLGKLTNLRVATISALENAAAAPQLKTVLTVLAALDIELRLVEKKTAAPDDLMSAIGIAEDSPE